MGRQSLWVMGDKKKKSHSMEECDFLVAVGRVGKLRHVGQAVFTQQPQQLELLLQELLLEPLP